VLTCSVVAGLVELLEDSLELPEELLEGLSEELLEDSSSKCSIITCTLESQNCPK